MTQKHYRWFGWLDLIGLVLTCSCIQACICAHVSCCMPCDSGWSIWVSVIFLLIHPLLLRHYGKGRANWKNKHAWFYWIFHQDDDAAKQNEKHVRSLAWTTSKVDQSCDTWKLNSPPRSRFANSLDICHQIFAIWGCCWWTNGEIKQFKPSDSWEESGLRSEWRTVVIHEIWLKKKASPKLVKSDSAIFWLPRRCTNFNFEFPDFVLLRIARMLQFH